jgi:nicotinate-nucleotide pyrophosphorylase
MLKIKKSKNLDDMKKDLTVKGTFNMVADAKLLVKFKTACVLNGVGMTEVVLQAMKDYIEKHKEQHK